MGDRGASNRGDRRPRAVCINCSRSIAVTFNKRTGEAYLRSHNTLPQHGLRCPNSNKTVSRGQLR